MNELTKPVLENEIVANIKGTLEVENNINEAKEFAIKLKDYYSEIVFTDEQIPDAKKERTGINNIIKKISSYRKNIIEEFKKPILTFETTAKETEKILEETADFVDVQVKKYEEQKRLKLETKIKDYFNEYLQSKNIDFITYEQSKINVNMSDSETKKKTEAKAFIDKISNDLVLIDTQDHKAEILVEYKQNLDVSLSITTVVNRFKRIEEEKIRQEELAKIKEVEKQAVAKVEEVIMPNPELKAPTMAEDEITVTFDITATPTVIQNLEGWMKHENIKFERSF